MEGERHEDLASSWEMQVLSHSYKTSIPDFEIYFHYFFKGPCWHHFKNCLICLMRSESKRWSVHILCLLDWNLQWGYLRLIISCLWQYKARVTIYSSTYNLTFSQLVLLNFLQIVWWIFYKERVSHYPRDGRSNCSRQKWGNWNNFV